MVTGGGRYRSGCARWLSLVLLSWLAGLPEHGGLVADELSAVLPSGAVVCLELRDADQVLDRLQRSEVLSMLLASPQHQGLQSTPAYRKLQAVRTLVERQLGIESWELIRGLFGQSVALAAYPQEGHPQPDFVLVARVTQPDLLVRLRQQLDPLIVLGGDQLQVTETLSGAEIISLDKQLFIAWKETWLALSTRRALLDVIIERVDEQAGDSLAHGAAYGEMLEHIEKTATAPDDSGVRLLRVFVDTGQLNQAAADGFLPGKLDNALGSLLLSDLFESVMRSPFAALTLDIHANHFLATATVAGQRESWPQGYQAFFPPAEEMGIQPLPAVSNLLAGLTIYRDFAKWYIHREHFLQEQVLPGFDQFETGLANILPGRDFAQDILPLLGNRLTMLAVPQDYGHLGGEPGVKLPAFALVTELAQREEGGELLQLFFQTLTAIFNIQAGQQGRQPWVLSSETYQGVQVWFAKYLQKPSGDRLDIVFNFLPASARVEDKFIICSSLDLCRQLIDAYQSADAPQLNPPQTVRSELRVDRLVNYIRINHDFFLGRMMQQGRTADDAQSELAALVDLLDRIHGISLNTLVHPQSLQVQLEGRWK